MPPRESQKSEHKLTKPRKYQQRCIDQAIKQNTIVVLPTGAGKTLIAAHVIDHYIDRRQPKDFAVFIVPTKLLVKQQSENLAKETNLAVMPFHGGNSIVRLAKDPFQILVCTADVFTNISSFLKIDHIRVVVLDECHHCVKKHPMRNITKWIFQEELKCRLLGLTASCSYKVDHSKIEKDVVDLCKELRTGSIVSASEEELANDGYNIPKSGEEDQILEDYEHDDNMDLFREEVHDVINNLEAELLKLDRDFVSPREDGCKPADWRKYCAARMQLKKDGTNANAVAAYKIMFHWYEVLRLVANENDGCSQVAFKYLLMSFNSGRDWKDCDNANPFQTHTKAIMDSWKERTLD